MIVDRIAKFLETNRLPILEEYVGAFTEGVVRSLNRQLSRRDSEARDGYHASSPWFCSRKMLLGMAGAEGEPLTPTSMLTFHQGDYYEQLGIMLTRCAMPEAIISPGLDGKQERVIVPVGGVNVEGNIDMVIRDPEGNEIPVDWKSTNGYGIDEAKDANTNPGAKWWTDHRFRYLTQLRLYMEAKKSPYGLFCYFNKEAGTMLEIRVQPDPVWRSELEQRARYTESFRVKGELSPKPSFATVSRKDGANQRADGSKGPVEEIEHFLCRYCEMKKHCFPGFDLVALANKPVWRKAV